MVKVVLTVALLIELPKMSVAMAVYVMRWPRADHRSRWL